MIEPNETNIRKEILDMAEHCINGDRDQQYGHPEDNFNTIANFWNNYIHAKYPTFGWGMQLNGEDVGMMMALFKIARAATGKFKIDNYVDLVGYAACAGECAERAERGDKSEINHVTYVPCNNRNEELETLRKE